MEQPEIEQVWGLAGALAECRPGDIAIVHDVLSFSTTVSVALDHDAVVFPFAWQQGSAEKFALGRAAIVAAPRGTIGQVTLSPASFRAAGVVVPEKVVLPSPNGSTISFALADKGVQVLAAGYRNAAATARWLARQPPARIVCISAGERWPDGSLRPAFEDLMGAGMLIAEIHQATGTRLLAPEAKVALFAYRGVSAQGTSNELAELVASSISGQELIQQGFANDVEIACELNTSDSVAVFDSQGGYFRRH